MGVAKGRGLDVAFGMGTGGSRVRGGALNGRSQRGGDWGVARHKGWGKGHGRGQCFRGGDVGGEIGCMGVARRAAGRDVPAPSATGVPGTGRSPWSRTAAPFPPKKLRAPFSPKSPFFPKKALIFFPQKLPSHSPHFVQYKSRARATPGCYPQHFVAL